MALRAACLDRATTVDKGHGRIEKRTLELTTWLEEYLGDDWQGCRITSSNPSTRHLDRFKTIISHGVALGSSSASEALYASTGVSHLGG